MLVHKVVLDKREYSIALDDARDDGANHFSVLIGRNGSGKSRIISQIIRAILSVHHIKDHPAINKAALKPSLQVKSGNNSLAIKNARGINILVDSKNKETRGQKEFGKIIAITTSPFDKFPLEEQKSKDYHYLGLRTSERNISKKKPINYLAKALLNHGINEKLEEVFLTLGYKSQARIIFEKEKPEKKSEFINPYAFLTSGDNLDLLNNLELRYRNMYLKRIISGKEHLLNAKMSKELESFPREKIVTSESTPEKNLSKFIDLGAISIRDIEFQKMQGGSFNLNEASSGEQCLLLTILCIASVIEDNSIVCIDEPEIILHPEWQHRFIGLLHHAFSSYNKVHFIIATHSPLIISSIPKDNSFIIKLDEDKILDGTEYHKKSADYQLVNVFGYPGHANEYLNRLCISILSRIKSTKSIDKDTMTDIAFIKGFKSKMSATDPVLDLIDVIEMVAEALNIDN